MRNIFLLLALSLVFSAASAQSRSAPAPLYRDPLYDGAADPTVIYHPARKEWWMFYTQRRANVETADVAYCYGTAIGVAVSKDHGQTWVYKGALNLEFEEGMNTFWAPDIVMENGVYHLFVAYIRGVRNHWGGKAIITRYTSSDLWNWKHEGDLKLSSESVIDPCFMKLADGKWHIWYKDQSKGSVTMTGVSNDLKQWTIAPEPAIGGDPHEGPKAFFFKGAYWMITDEWAGQRLYKSADARKWEKQGRLLDGVGKRKDDSPQGAHADVVVTGDKAYIFYFTHPGRKKHTDDGGPGANGNILYAMKRSSIQVAELVLRNGTLATLRDEPFDFWLP
ncbi:MAG: family 43 glycosylhydrolase [Flavihumibacter sp.]